MFSSRNNSQTQQPTEAEVTPAQANPATSSTPSIIAADLSILGNMMSEGGVVEIQGRVEGNVTGKSVTVRDTGYIKGDIVADMISIGGRACGLIKAKLVKLSSTAKVAGVIMYEKLSIEDGALVDAQCKRVEENNANEPLETIEYTEEIEDPKAVRIYDLADAEETGIEEIN